MYLVRGQVVKKRLDAAFAVDMESDEFEASVAMISWTGLCTRENGKRLMVRFARLEFVPGRIEGKDPSSQYRPTLLQQTLSPSRHSLAGDPPI